MNKDEVISLAEKCKLAVLIHSQWTAEIKEFTVVDYVVEGDLGSLMQFATLVASAEREACAKLLEEASEAAKDVDPQGFVWLAIKTSAEGIRERSNHD